MQWPDWKVCKMRKGDRSFTENMCIKILKIAQICYFPVKASTKKKWLFISMLYFISIQHTLLHFISIPQTAECGVFQQDLRCAIMPKRYAAVQEKYSGALVCSVY